MATLDKSTCETCAYYDGKHYPVKDAVEGENHPSFHINCRCTTAPYISDTVGISSGRISRDPVTGKNVPTTAKTYGEWKVQQDKKYGAGTIDIERKKAQNETSDFKQYQKYKEIFKEKYPQTFADFQNLKYNNIKEFERMKQSAADQKIKNRILSGEQPKNIDLGKQGKHIKGHNNYQEGKSYLTISMQEAQKLIDKYAGTGEILRDSKGVWNRKERVHADDKIGVWVSGKLKMETSNFIIHYGKNGVHIVPARKVNIS